MKIIILAINFCAYFVRSNNSDLKTIVRSNEPFKYLLGLGWGRGHIAYGLGLMLKQTSWARGARYGEWGTYLGHGGNTYGFLSEQGLIPQLNATFSVVANSNADDLFVAGVLTCQIIAVAAEEVLGHNIRLPCGG